MSIPPAPGDTLHTTEVLARALEAADDPALAGVIARARQGYYHDYLSPLATPELQLVADLRATGHEEFAQRVIAGEFDASPAESDAWMRSAEGQATLAEFGSLVGRQPTGEAFWRAQRPPEPRRPE